MSRREMREQVFKLLFRVEFNEPAAMSEQKELFFDNDEVVISEDDEMAISEEMKKEASDKEESWSPEREMWLQDMIKLVLYQEVFKRRSKNAY